MELHESVVSEMNCRTDTNSDAYLQIITITVATETWVDVKVIIPIATTSHKSQVTAMLLPIHLNMSTDW